MTDVQRILGVPDSKDDIANYSKPYPGDDSSIQPVWSYESDSLWTTIVYFVKSGYPENELYPKSLGNKLFSIELIPKKKISFDKSNLRSKFTKKHVLAADAAWDEYSDKTGLTYNTN